MTGGPGCVSAEAEHGYASLLPGGKDGEALRRRAKARRSGGGSRYRRGDPHRERPRPDGPAELCGPVRAVREGLAPVTGQVPLSRGVWPGWGLSCHRGTGLGKVPLSPGM